MKSTEIEFLNIWDAIRSKARERKMTTLTQMLQAEMEKARAGFKEKLQKSEPFQKIEHRPAENVLMAAHVLRTQEFQDIKLDKQTLFHDGFKDLGKSQNARIIQIGYPINTDTYSPAVVLQCLAAELRDDERFAGLSRFVDSQMTDASAATVRGSHAFVHIPLKEDMMLVVALDDYRDRAPSLGMERGRFTLQLVMGQAIDQTDASQ